MFNVYDTFSIFSKTEDGRWEGKVCPGCPFVRGKMNGRCRGGAKHGFRQRARPDHSFLGGSRIVCDPLHVLGVLSAFP